MQFKSILLVTLVVFSLYSCEKDNDSLLTKNSHRIKQIIEYYNGTIFSKRIFSYEGERLVNIIYEKNANDNWFEEFKSEISYSGDTATKTNFIKDTASWIISSKTEYIIQNGLCIEVFTYDYENGGCILDYKWEYQYTGNIFIGWKGYLDNEKNGILEFYSKGEFIYQNGKFIEYKGYGLDKLGNWHQYDKETFFYTGDNLTSYVNYYLDESDNWLADYKYEYLYSGSYVSNEEYYIWNIVSNTWESERSKSFSYNNNGYFIEELRNDGKKTTFEYEEGHGNAIVFLYTPSYLVHGQPTFKSTDSVRKYLPYYKIMINESLRQLTPHIANSADSMNANAGIP